MNLIIGEMEMINSLCLYYIMSTIDDLYNIDAKKMMEILIEIRRDLANTRSLLDTISSENETKP